MLVLLGTSHIYPYLPNPHTCLRTHTCPTHTTLLLRRAGAPRPPNVITHASRHPVCCAHTRAPLLCVLQHMSKLKLPNRQADRGVTVHAVGNMLQACGNCKTDECPTRSAAQHITTHLKAMQLRVPPMPPLHYQQHMRLGTWAPTAHVVRHMHVPRCSCGCESGLSLKLCVSLHCLSSTAQSRWHSTL